MRSRRRLFLHPQLGPSFRILVCVSFRVRAEAYFSWFRRWTFIQPFQQRWLYEWSFNGWSTSFEWCSIRWFTTSYGSLGTNSPCLSASKLAASDTPCSSASELAATATWRSKSRQAWPWTVSKTLIAGNLKTKAKIWKYRSVRLEDRFLSQNPTLDTHSIRMQK